MSLIHAVILGLVEGMTEFLPISSTAHLLIAGRMLGIKQTEFLTFFDVFIQSGAILAVVILYFSYVLSHRDLWGKIIVSFIPTALVGLILEKIIKKYFFNSLPLVISAMFIVGAAFVVFEYLVKKKKIKQDKTVKQMTVTEALLIGVGQSLAVVPGVSRAGAVMLTMMSQKFRRDEAAVYSFLLAVPTILAASALEVLKTDLKIITESSNLSFLLIGFFTSFVTAYLVIKWFIGFLKTNSLTIFGIYRMILSFVLFMI
jgi:undecaprenyl-diphosphatase